MNFTKYCSIENSYDQANLSWWLSNYPMLRAEKYAIHEKIHGANLQVASDRGEDVKIGTRNNWLDDISGFYNVGELILSERFETFVEKLKAYAHAKNVFIIIFGELYGAGIMKGVNYPKGRHFAPFDVVIDGVYQDYGRFVEILKELGIQDLMAPEVASRVSLDEALAFDVESFRSKLLDQEGENIAEGVVIKPMITYVNATGSRFALKKKSEKFSERASVKKAEAGQVVPEEVVCVQNLFTGYITENRMNAVVSKLGPIVRPDQIGEYIKALMEDAREDFLKEHKDQLAALDKKLARKVFTNNRAAEIVVGRLKHAN